MNWTTYHRFIRVYERLVSLSCLSVDLSPEMGPLETTLQFGLDSPKYNAHKEAWTTDDTEEGSVRSDMSSEPCTDIFFPLFLILVSSFAMV